jgi:hypothetical protein
MPSLPGRILWVLPALLALPGCLTPPPKGKSILKPAQMSPNSVALEIISVRFPLGDPEVNGRLWNEVDEQHFPAELRQQLAKNGFRAGVIGGQMPDVLGKLLELKEKSPEPGEPQKANPAELEANSRVSPRHLQTRAGCRSEVIASGVYDNLPVLVSEAGELRGVTYSEAQGVLALTALPQADGRVRLEVVPELHHGQARPHFVGDQAMWRLETGRSRKTLDEMKISALLAPGTILLLGSMPDRPGSLGHYFFTEGDDKIQQKLLVVRLCQTQHDDLVTPPPLRLQE